MPDRPKIAIMTSGDLLSAVALAPLFERLESDPGSLAYEVACVLDTSLMPQAKRRLARRAISKGAHLYLLFMLLEPFATRRVARRWGPLVPDVFGRFARLSVPVARFEDVNAGGAGEFVRTHGSDEVVCVRPSQILRERLIKASPPISNFHCTLLPRYRGVAGVFHTLREGEHDLAVTLHRIVDERVDAGPIIEQRVVPADRPKPLAQHHAELFRAAGEMLAALDRFPAGEPQDERDASLMTWPTNREVLAFRRDGGRLLRASGR